ncbi:uncharacterized protein LOC131857723 [Cryptomeria japonica]|uniref:uncharacterized protein LOC131857723 n=1 Tax=Cryptomeria japonica TaxID=3369 RepID=UPI0027DA1F0B|nr:uncharacterized protein LOC131857723 [Cryptomeria japonica]
MALSLVGKFMGPRPNIDLVRDFAKKKWCLKGQIEITAMPKGFFSFAFSCEEDLYVVLCGGPWVIGKTSLALKCWFPNLDLNDGSFSSAPVWVRVPSFPLEFWHEDVFKGLASSFGELLSVDPMMAARKRMVYARIYICISQNIDLPSSMDIISKLGKWTQPVEFETISFVCFHCKKYRHWDKKCPLQTNTNVSPNNKNVSPKSDPR